MGSTRWDWLEGLKAESATSAAVNEMGKMLVEELMNWPPEVTPAADSESQMGRFAEILTSGAPRPAKEAYFEALKRVDWELRREFEAIDHYERNNHLAKVCPHPRDQLGAEFIQHYLLEAFFGLMEKTEYRVKRADIVRGLDRMHQRFTGQFADA